MPFNDISIWNSDGSFVQQSGNICAIFLEGIKRNNSVKLFSILTSGSGGDVLRYFLFGAL